MKNNTLKQCIIFVHGLFPDHENNRFAFFQNEYKKNNQQHHQCSFISLSNNTHSKVNIKKRVAELETLLTKLKCDGCNDITVIAGSFGALITLLSEQKANSTILLSPVLSSNNFLKLFIFFMLTKIYPTKYFYNLRKLNIPFFIYLLKLIPKQRTILKNTHQKILVFHGTKDTHVPFDSTKTAMQYLSNATLLPIDTNNHIFNNKELRYILKKSTNFINYNSTK